LGLLTIYPEGLQGGVGVVVAVAGAGVFVGSPAIVEKSARTLLPRPKAEARLPDAA
jgi:hypothetical protein